MKNEKLPYPYINNEDTPDPYIEGFDIIKACQGEQWTPEPTTGLDIFGGVVGLFVGFYFLYSIVGILLILVGII